MVLFSPIFDPKGGPTLELLCSQPQVKDLQERPGKKRLVGPKDGQISNLPLFVLTFPEGGARCYRWLEFWENPSFQADSKVVSPEAGVSEVVDLNQSQGFSFSMLAHPECGYTEQTLGAESKGSSNRTAL